MLPFRVAFETLGCKLNQAETEDLVRQFTALDCVMVNPGDIADIYIFNTCTVTHMADRKSRQCIRTAKRLNPEALVVALGCYVESSRDALRAAGAGLVLGNADKMALVPRLQEMGYFQTQPVSQKIAGMRTRSMVAVQQGCSHFCSYCIVPYVRGPGQSYSSDTVINAIKARVSEGYKEVVLTGTEIGTYNYAGLSLKELIEIILEETGVERLRLSSLQPGEITADMLALWPNPRLCPHFHISLQSGSDSVLKRMRRSYTLAEYADTLALIHSRLPDAAITTDVIVGFPGETVDEFTECLEFCRRMRFARMHIFPYSRRNGTEAAAMDGQVDDLTKKDRSRVMLALARSNAGSFRRSFLGGSVDVLWEQKSASGIWEGYSGNYIRIYSSDSNIGTNLMAPVTLTGLYRDGLWGQIKASG